ncbi:MAG: methylated-DNA--[protein]-cysteine S-methyltransferase [Helicobacteraceae bacterium]|jgi:methylated-DNA-[protein]-cysteine S-methyltransferase|nr:methylated-DNA--[protein]-cysteine S-methyltransferase [Helicobacteraceae bacterium]
MNDEARYETLQTPIGELFVLASADRLLSIGFSEPKRKRAASPIASKTIGLLDEYFRGDRVDFSALPFAMPPQPFYRTTLQALLAISYGSRLTYGDLAALAGNAKAYRAAASAIANNPFAIAVPCHRIVPKSGGVGAYGWGASKKAWLLHHEAINCAEV